MRELEVRVLGEVIDAVEEWVRDAEVSGQAVPVPRSQIYASVIQAVLASARETGHYGPGSLASAPLLDAILSGAEVNPWDTAIFAVLMEGSALS